MTRRHRFLLIAATVLLPTAAGACQVDHFSFVMGSDASTHMAVRNLESCKFGFKPSPRTHISGSGIAQSPQHGTLTQADETHWMYKPAHGYTGQDAIVVKVSGENMGKFVHEGDTNITWTVDVAP